MVCDCIVGAEATGLYKPEFCDEGCVIKGLAIICGSQPPVDRREECLSLAKNAVAVLVLSLSELARDLRLLEEACFDRTKCRGQLDTATGGYGNWRCVD